MTNEIKVEEFIRIEENPGAVVNVNDFALTNYKKQRSAMYDQRDKINKINSIEQELVGLKEDISYIKDLLKKVLK